MLASEMKAVSRWIAALGGIGLATAALAQDLDQAFHSILAVPAVTKALADIKADDARTFEEQKSLTEIPSPPFKEKARAADYVKRLREAGLSNAYTDREGNVIGVRKGRGGPTLLVTADHDAVFLHGAAVVTEEEDGHRYEAIFKGPGGHSFGAFGLPSAIHAMGRAIAKISDVRTPSSPKTTFTVGTVRGGTSVNAIAGDARMGIDMRSDSMDELLKLE